MHSYLNVVKKCERHYADHICSIDSMWLTVFISILGAFLILLFALAFYAYVYHEDFEDAQQNQEQQLKASYDNYVTFYNAFMSTWEKAVTTSIGSSTPPTRTELNAQVTVLSKGLPIPLPPITDPLPSTLDPNFQPVHPLSFLNALQWMNRHMEESHAALQQSLKGGKPLEGFVEFFEDTPTCQQIIQCTNQQQQQKTADLLGYFQRFEVNQELQDAWAENQRLAAESKKIQDQAQSGELAAQLVPSESSSISFARPAGANQWDTYKKTHPKDAERTVKTLGPWAAVADWAHQINHTF